MNLPRFRFLPRPILLLAVILLVPSVTGAAETLESRLAPLIEGHRGAVAVAVRHLETGEAFAYRESEPMPTASLIKFPVMVEAYRQAAAGKLDLDKMVALREEDKVPGSGILTRHFSAGLTLSVRDAIRLMIAYSDNTATNLVLDQIGLASTGELMAELGCPETRIHAKVYRRDTSISPERSRRFGLGSTTARDMVHLYGLLHRRRLVSAEASGEMLEHLFQCDDRTKLRRFLPDGTKFAHKTGAVSAARCDAGIIYSPRGPIAICVLTSDNEDRRWSEEAAANRLCAEIGRAVYVHFCGVLLPEKPILRELRKGDSGRLVEDLQRTLNARLSPSPELGADGDFGPVTEAAVLRFQ
jgi:beta-lactamase class A